MKSPINLKNSFFVLLLFCAAPASAQTLKAAIKAPLPLVEHGDIAKQNALPKAQTIDEIIEESQKKRITRERIDNKITKTKITRPEKKKKKKRKLVKKKAAPVQKPVAKTAPAPAPAPEEKKKKVTKKEEKIKVGDSLNINVQAIEYDKEANKVGYMNVAGNTPVIVDEQGFINLAIMGEISAKDLSAEQLAEQIKAKTLEYYKFVDSAKVSKN